MTDIYSLLAEVHNTQMATGRALERTLVPTAKLRHEARTLVPTDKLRREFVRTPDGQAALADDPSHDDR